MMSAMWKRKKDAAQPGPLSSPPSDEIEISSSYPPYKTSALAEIVADTDEEDMEVTGVPTPSSSGKHTVSGFHILHHSLWSTCAFRPAVWHPKGCLTAGDTLTCERSTMTPSKVD